MAEQISQNVVNEAQSMGDPSPIDVSASSTQPSGAGGEALPENSNANPRSSNEQAFSTNEIASAAPDVESSVVTDTESSKLQDANSTAAQATGSADDLKSAPVNSERKSSDQAGLENAAEHLTNGDTASHVASEDGQISSIPEHGVGSDTDISRPGSVDPSKEDATRHERSNSIKKPASFKSVSVTKSFLAKAAGTPVPTKTGEKSRSSRTMFPIYNANPFNSSILKPGSCPGSADSQTSPCSKVGKW